MQSNSFRASSRILGSGRTETREVHHLQRGQWLYKYGYSDSSLIKRFFWLSPDLSELRWGSSVHDPRYLRVCLSEMIGLTFGPITTTFSRLRYGDVPSAWCCFSLIFVGRTLDLCTIEDNAHVWFLTLQSIASSQSDCVIPSVSRGALLRKKVVMKIRSKARSLGRTLVEHFKLTISQCACSINRIDTPVISNGPKGFSPATESFRSRDIPEQISRLRGDLSSLRDSIEHVQVVTLEAIEERLYAFLGPVFAALAPPDAEALSLANAERKRLHNELMELKGNIRVFTRIRPLLQGEVDHADEPTITTTEDAITVYNEADGRRRTFEFDSVFAPTSAQSDVFSRIEPFVTSFIHGYNVCLFAYGVTNSGKTYTMEGTVGDSGVNMLAIQKVFAEKPKGTFVSMSVIQIYNEAVYDLLNQRNHIQLKVLDHTVCTPGVTDSVVSTPQQAAELIRSASLLRATNTTKLNQASSRSHCVVSVHLRSHRNPSAVLAKLNLVDLAGSENINRSGATGTILKEAQSINKSLSALGDVIHALLECKQDRLHVPFRNSKLTMLLRDSLQRNSKTLMIVQVSPKQADVTETLGSLQFGARVRTVELGKPKRNSVIENRLPGEIRSPTRGQ